MPCLSASQRSIKTLTECAISLAYSLRRNGLSLFEGHPASTREAFAMPTKDWRKIQTLLKQIGLTGDVKTRILTSHEIDAVTATLTAYLHLQRITREVGNEEEGYIVIPKRNSWRHLKNE